MDGEALAAVVNSHRVPHLRLWGVDAPVLRDTGKVETAVGMRARVALAELVAGKSVTVRPVECDAYGRTVATVEAGAAEFVTKPVDFDNLKRQLPRLSPPRAQSGA